MGRLRVIAIVVALVVVGGLLWFAWAPRADDKPVLSGYVEGEALYMASPIAGAVTELSVVRGQRVAAGAPLFTIDAGSLDAQRQQAVAQIAQAQAQGGVAEASHRQLQAAADAAQATAEDAARDAARAESLHRDSPGAISAEAVDKARATAVSATAQFRAAQRQADAAAAQIGVARAQAAQAEGVLADVGSRLIQVAPTAPSAARVEDTYFQKGEWAAANQPVLSLLPDAKVKLRFFAPEKSVNLYQPGRSVRFDCDGCQGRLTAVIDYVSPRPEYTPPEIYSRKTRDKLVFLVEAEPAEPARLSPGQPVDVTPLAAPGPAAQ